MRVVLIVLVVVLATSTVTFATAYFSKREPEHNRTCARTASGGSCSRSSPRHYRRAHSTPPCGSQQPRRPHSCQCSSRGYPLHLPLDDAPSPTIESLPRHCKKRSSSARPGSACPSMRGSSEAVPTVTRSDMPIARRALRPDRDRRGHRKRPGFDADDVALAARQRARARSWCCAPARRSKSNRPRLPHGHIAPSLPVPAARTLTPWRQRTAAVEPMKNTRKGSCGWIPNRPCARSVE